ncbi:hypothetical protein GCM10023322_46840 [Rugosimonospora acidiphila]|uniref:F5/8 type C domain-containing protein n=1 Tax=Rugosimonospora acidiphila TaxID=556531 RepID=A0ABP9S5P4_9ACTN
MRRRRTTGARLARVLLSAVVAGGFAVVAAATGPQAAHAAAPTITNDTNHKTVTMRSNGMTMVYQYDHQAVVSSFTMGTTQLLGAGMYSTLTLDADGTSLSSKTLTANPTVTVDGDTVSTTFTMKNATVSLAETWTFTLTDDNIGLSVARTYDWLNTANLKVRHNGELSIGWARVWDNIRRPADGGNLPIGNAYTGDNNFFLAKINDRYGVEESDFTMLRGATSQALDVDATGNHSLATEFAYTGDGNTYQETQVSTAPTWSYTAGTPASGLVYGGHSSNGTTAYIYAPQATAQGQQDTVSYTFTPDDYAKFYSLGGTINGVDNTAALSSMLNDFGRSGVVDKGYGMSTVGLRFPGVGPYDMVYADRTVEGYYDPAMTASQKNALQFFRDTAQSSSGHMNGRTYHLDHPWGDGSLYDADPSYAMAVADMYNYSPDSSWLTSMRTSVEKSLGYMINNQYNTTDGLFHNDLTDDASTKGIREWNDGAYIKYESGYINELMYEALVEWSQLEKTVFNDGDLASSYASIAAGIKTQFNKDDTDGGLWDTGTGMFAYWRNADGTVQGAVQDMEINLQAIYYGMVDLDRAKQILDEVDADMQLYHLDLIPQNFIPLQRDTETSHGNGFETGLENGAIYPFMTEEYMRAAAVVGERDRSLTYLNSTLNRYTQDGFNGWSYLNWFDQVRAGAQEAWFPSNANGASGLFDDVLGIQPTADGVTIAPNIPDSMNGTTVTRTIHAADSLTVDYTNELTEQVNYSSASQPVTLQWSGQKPDSTYTVTDNGAKHTVTADNLGTVRYTYTGSGTHDVALASGSAAGYVLPTLPGATDLALHKPVTASSSLEDGNFDTPTVTDGNDFTVASSFGWSSNNDLSENHTESVTVDLGAQQSISRVKLWPKDFDRTLVGNYFPIDFTIQTSADGNTWNTVVSKTNYPKPTDGSAQTFDFDATTARYVRVEGTNLRNDESNQYRMQLSEIEVFGSAPAAPAAPSIGVSNTSVNVTWAAPATNGAAPTGYTVTLTPQGGTPIVAKVAGTATSTSFANVAPGAYTATVVATNALGNSASSAASPVATVTAGKPVPLTVSAKASCVNGEATIAVYALNGSTGPADISLGAAGATQKSSAVASGKAAYHLFDTGASSAAGGNATVAGYSSRGGVGYYSTYTAAYSAISCK